jgi:hypothetical protein
MRGGGIGTSCPGRLASPPLNEWVVRIGTSCPGRLSSPLPLNEWAILRAWYACSCYLSAWQLNTSGGPIVGPASVLERSGRTGPTWVDATATETDGLAPNARRQVPRRLRAKGVDRDGADHCANASARQHRCVPPRLRARSAPPLPWRDRPGRPRRRPRWRGAPGAPFPRGERP